MSESDPFLRKLDEAITSLLEYCRRNHWAGHDPYDALNSKVFRATPFFRSRFWRIAFTQAMKRSPVNLRPLLRVPKEQNPKALALFSSALLKMPGGVNEAKDLLELMIRAKSHSRPYPCWGYNFDWQNRVSFVRRAEPNIICTTFAGNALLDAYAKLHDERYLHTAISTSEFLFQELIVAKQGGELFFGYTPADEEVVHNANLLGAAFLARLYSYTGIRKFLTHAISATKSSVLHQHADGSWRYSEGPSQQWVDNFHTGYNLVALKHIAAISGIASFDESLRRGFAFYKSCFFEADGRAKYYHNRTYPIDVHAIAQSLITLSELSDLGVDNLSLCQKIFEWAWDHMRHPSGYFYYQKRRLITDTSSYMRWSQSWMLLALLTLKQSFCGSPDSVLEPLHIPLSQHQ